MLSRRDKDYIAKFTADMDVYSIVPMPDGGWVCMGIGPKPKPQDAASKTFGGSLAWVGEARVPAGDGDDSGEWTNNDGSDDVVDAATRSLCADTAAVNFVKTHEAAANAIGQKYGVPGKYLLGLAARETGYGKPISSFAKYNAFFSLQRLFPDGKQPSQSDIARIPHATGAIRAGSRKPNGSYSWI